MTILEANRSDQMFMDYGEFEKHLKSLLGKVEGMSASRLIGIAMVLAVMDKTAVVQKDRKGEIIKDTTTKDTEIIKLTQDPEKYFEAEVYPHVPDAIWAYEFDPEKKESAINKEKLGAEFPFTRFFYEYKEPEKADDLLAQFMELEKSLSEKLRPCRKARSVMAEQMKPSGIDWIGEIPCSWNIKRIKYLAQLKGRIGWQGLTSDEYTDVGPFLITGVDFSNGGINWENCVHITEERWAEAPEIHIKNGDLLITKDGTVGKVAIVENLQGKASLNSGVLLIKTSNDYNKKFLYWALLSEEFWTWFRLKNAGNSTIVHLYQNDFAEFSYTFPDATEQQAIADFLDKECAQIDSIAADLEKQIALLQQYKNP